MSQIIIATVEDGLLRPDIPLALPSRTRVRLIIEPLPSAAFGTEPDRGEEWREVDRIWDEMDIDSGGPPPTREQLYERH
jgi:hypothetical protein